MDNLCKDHDFLSNLYKTNPEAFDEYRKELLEELFNKLPKKKQKHARQLQWKIESELRKYKDPIAKMNKMVEMFWEGVYEFKDVMKAVNSSENV